MHLGVCIKMALAKKGVTQVELARRVGISTRWVQKIVSHEGGQVETIQRVADALGMKASELIALGED